MQNRTQSLLSQTGSVFWITAALSTALVLWGVFFTGSFAAAATAAFGFTTANLSWF
jgi:choline-glycine betaine transporter